MSILILSKWEFDLRKKLNPQLDYEYAYSSYYTYRLTHGFFSARFLAQAGIVFTTLSLVLNLYFRFLY